MTGPPPGSVGLALGAGGARGIAHVVVLETLDELGVRPALIAGAAIGAVAGAGQAAGMSGVELRAWLLERTADRVGLMRGLVAARAPGLGDIFTRGGNPMLVDPERLARIFLPEVVPETFEELHIPLVTVATDFYTQTQHLSEAGPLRSALAASMAIPGLFRPVEIGGRVLIDGGMTNPLPFDLLAGRVETVIAVDVNGAPREGDRPGGRVPRPLDALVASFQIMAEAITLEKAARVPPDVLLRPAVSRFRVLDFLKAPAILEAAAPLRDQLKRALAARLID
jgi:NTE family protein